MQKDRNAPPISRRQILMLALAGLPPLMLPYAIQAQAQPSSSAEQALKLVEAARAQIGQTLYYNGAYERLDYPNGDIPIERGVCTDVIIRAYRKAFNFDLQKAIHEDMRRNFSAYPNNWGAKTTDRNIDHRRVPNQQAFFKRQGTALTVTQSASDFLAGDIVSHMLPGNLPHILIVSDRKNSSGTPLAIHNIGRGTQEENILFNYQITGHYRFFPEQSNL